MEIDKRFICEIEGCGQTIERPLRIKGKTVCRKCYEELFNEVVKYEN